MHVDYVSLNGESPDVVNFSVLPNNYYSQFSTIMFGSNQSTVQSTTSYSQAVDLSSTTQAGYESGPTAGVSGPALRKFAG